MNTGTMSILRGARVSLRPHVHPAPAFPAPGQPPRLSGPLPRCQSSRPPDGPEAQSRGAGDADPTGGPEGP